MTRNRLLLVFLSIVILACQAVSWVQPRPAPAPLTTPAASFTPASSSTPIPRLTATAEQTAVPDEAAASLPAPDFSVRVHPDGGLFVGDQVSFEVITPPGLNPSGQQVQVSLATRPDDVLATAEFGKFGIGGRSQATLLWAWDTKGLSPGSYRLEFSLIPDGSSWQETVELLPAGQVPAPQPAARWAQASNQCCIIHYITGSQAERDLPALLQMADGQAEHVSQRMGVSFAEPVPVVFLARLLGHGGFTNQEISISYLDRNYAGGNQAIVLHHEMVHWLDSQLGGELRPTLFVEGLAVYLSGGHFKTEELPPRAAALVELGWYLPLIPLADRFYPAQHETGYIQAGALVQYMVERWGWEAFQRFYRDIHPDPGGGEQSVSINLALLAHFDLDFEQLEAGFLEYLSTLEVTPDTLEDVRTTVMFYDTLRDYQLLLDPSAYYLTAWLPDGVQLRERGIVADFLRRPSSPLNISLETLLVAANQRLLAGDILAARRLLIR